MHIGRFAGLKLLISRRPRDACGPYNRFYKIYAAAKSGAVVFDVKQISMSDLWECSLSSSERTCSPRGSKSFSYRFLRSTEIIGLSL